MAAPTNTAKKGRLLLIKASDGASPPSYSTVMGVRSRTVTINNEQTDITDSDNAPWRALLEDAGLRSITINASGVYKDDTAGQDVFDYAMTGAVQSYLIQFPNGDLLEGEFQVGSYEGGGEHTAEQTFSIVLESAATPAFTRA